MKTAVVFYSKHHGNTKKLLDAVAKNNDVTLIDALAQPDADLSGFDLIGFASGVYYSKFHKSVLKIAENVPNGKPVFFMYTYGAKKDGYTKAVREAVQRRSAVILGEYGCMGFDTFGPLKLIGGIAKGRPNDEEVRDAVRFFNSLSDKI